MQGYIYFLQRLETLHPPSSILYILHKSSSRSNNALSHTPPITPQASQLFLSNHHSENSDPSDLKSKSSSHQDQWTPTNEFTLKLSKMNYKLFKYVASTLTHSPSAWKPLIGSNLTSGSRFALPRNPNTPDCNNSNIDIDKVAHCSNSSIKDAAGANNIANLKDAAATLIFKHQALKGEPGREKLYNRFHIQSPSAVKGYTEWRNEHMSVIDVRVGGTHQSIIDMLEDMVGDSQCDGTWAGEGRVA